MATIYEFQVAGLIGSVVRSALPEMQTFEEVSGQTLRGATGEQGEIDRLLDVIQAMNLVVQRLQICVRADSGLARDVPVVDDRGAQNEVLE